MIYPDAIRDISLKVTDLLGIHFPENRLSDLERGLLAAAKELHIEGNLDAINNWLSDPRLSSEDLIAVSSHLTIGETYFFREENALKFFRDSILPELMGEWASTGRAIRIWSAGCSSGEEPYTIAMLLKESIPDISSWKITILATDINPVAINKARLGVYSAWSFRETSDELKKKYFKGSGRQWEIIPEIKEMVTFVNLNLAQEIYPATLVSSNQMDVIFCRNVLMYFSPEKMKEVAFRFHHILKEKGWFITSQVELNDDYFFMFSRHTCSNGIYYQKNSSPEKPAKSSLARTQVVTTKEPKVNRPARPPVASSEQRHRDRSISKTLNQPERAVSQSLSVAMLFQRGEYLNCAKECRKKIEAGSSDNDILTLLIQSYANLGQMSEARIYAEKLVALDGSQSGHHQILATILLELNELQLAEGSLQKVLYIDPDYVFAHLTMGYVIQRSGRKQQAARYFRNAETLLEDCEDDEVVPGSGGLTAGRVREFITLSLNSRK